MSDAVLDPPDRGGGQARPSTLPPVPPAGVFRSSMPQGAELVVLGFAQAFGKGYRPTTADWVLMGDRGRAFQHT